MTDFLTRSYKPSGDAVDARVGDETVILHMEKGTYFGLDAVGARIWELLGSDTAMRDICDILAAEFGTRREVIEQDVKVLLDDLLANDLVVRE